jgi:anti-anti-sigma factor
LSQSPKNEEMEIKLTEFERWKVIEIKGSVDALNSRLVTEPLLKLIENGELCLALNLEATSFLCLPAINFIGNTARMLAAKGGELCVIAPNDRTKRHIEVFAGFKYLNCYDSFTSLLEGRAQVPSPQSFNEFSQ